MSRNFKRLRIKFIILLIASALAIGTAPIWLPFLGLFVASIQGCDTTGVQVTCPGNADLGARLTAMFVLHWLGLVTLPLTAIILMGLLV